jgi:hypothetical protein
MRSVDGEGDRVGMLTRIPNAIFSAVGATLYLEPSRHRADATHDCPTG